MAIVESACGRFGQQGDSTPLSRSMSRPCRAGLEARSRGSCDACLNVQTANSIPECLRRKVPRTSKTHAKMACTKHVIHISLPAVLPLLGVQLARPKRVFESLICSAKAEGHQQWADPGGNHYLQVVRETVGCHKAALQQAHEPCAQGRRSWLHLSVWRQLCVLWLRAMKQAKHTLDQACIFKADVRFVPIG